METSEKVEPVNRDTLLQVTGGDENFAGELLSDFAGERYNEGKKLNALLIDGDSDEILRLAHRLKGSCTVIGATRLIEMCQNIELAARDPAGNARQFAQGFAQEWRELFQWLHERGYSSTPV